MSFNKRCNALVDARCLQDPNYARRGVGRHTLALLRGVPSEAFRLVGIIDPEMPPLIEEALEAFDEVVTNAYAAAMLARRGDCFVELSPMTHDPLFVARLAADPRLMRIVVVYDFIPQRWPERYLPRVGDRLGYALQLRWLAGYDVFAPISQSAADDLSATLGPPKSAVAVTGAPLDPGFELASEIGGGSRRHVLVVGGGDSRKNPEVVIRAHARCQRAQDGAGFPLVVAGNYDAHNRTVFRAIYEAEGGRGDLIEVPGGIPERDLLSLYGRARIVVCPSRDEGFSLPVVEGMAAGAPVIASDIPAHRELVTDHDLLFAPDDAEALSALLGRLLDDDTACERIVAEQAPVWPKFRARDVASRFWDAATAGLAARKAITAPAIGRGRRPRVALLTPMPPDRSGVADYTAATCAEFGKLVDLHVFTETKSPSPVERTTLHPLSAYPHLAPGFDRVVSVIGNSQFHVSILDALRQYGGACIAHDARMLSFYRILKVSGYAEKVASRELGRAVSIDEINGWLADEASMKAVFLGEIAESASPMIVHSAITAQMVAERHGTSPVLLPFSVYRSWDNESLSRQSRMAARARLGLREGEVAIATFGFLHGTKAPEEVIWALDTLRGWGVNASLHFVGADDTMSDGGAALRSLAGRLGLEDRVRFVGKYISEEAFSDYLIGSDFAVQLRTYGLGGLSGAIMDCAAVGLPTVANESLVRACAPPLGYFRAVPDAISPLLLAEAIAKMHEAGVTPTAVEEERRGFVRDRSMATYSRRLAEALQLDVPPRLGLAV